MIFNILFNQGYVQDMSNKDKPVRFLFTDYSRLSSVGGETSLAEMVGALRTGFRSDLNNLKLRFSTIKLTTHNL